MKPNSKLDIDLTAIAANASALRKVVSAGAGEHRHTLCAVLKADGYGLGAARLARHLTRSGPEAVAASVDMIAVYTPSEARVLLEAAVGCPILILMPVRDIGRADGLYHALSRQVIHLAVHARDGLASIAAIADHLGLAIPVHIMVDTGMGREGASPEEAIAVVRDASQHRRLRIAGVATHFACADTDAAGTAAQADRFDAFLEQAADYLPKDCLIHCANTYAALQSPRHLRTMTRIGIGLFGFGPEAPAVDQSQCPPLHPAVRWTSSIVQIKELAHGATVGYGATWQAQRRTRLALVPVGYADGYLYALSNRGRVAITLRNQTRAFVPVIGRVSMDQLCIDITDLPDYQIGLDHEVELVGLGVDEPNSVPVLADIAGVPTHDLLVGLGRTAERIYHTLPVEKRPVRTAPQPFTPPPKSTRSRIIEIHADS